MIDNDIILDDRIMAIQAIKDELKDKGYLSFSGEKDSTIVHYLLDIALPNNRIPRVFFDTGIEFNEIKNFVKELDILEELLPNEKKQCEIIWKPIYEEYRRIGYRLRKETGQMKLF